MPTTYLLLFLLFTLLLTPTISSNSFSKMKEWIDSNQGLVDSLSYPSYFPERGVQAMRDFSPGDWLMRIPKRLWMHGASFTDSAILARKLGLSEVKDHMALSGLCSVIMVMEEKMKAKDSFFEPFLETLPLEFKSMRDYSEDALWGFQDFRLILERRKHVKTFQDLWGYVNVVMKAEKVEFELFRWAYDVVGTRSFRVYGRNESVYDHVLVPVADMLNHDAASFVHWSAKPTANRSGHEEEALIMFIDENSPHGFVNGSQVFNNYGGDGSNFLTFSDYHFVAGNNMRDSVRLHFQNQTRKFIRLVASNTNLIALFAFCRGLEGLPASILNERRALQACVKHLENKLNSMPTTLEHDEALLANVVDDDEKMPLVYRISRKRIFSKHIELCKLALVLSNCLSLRSVRGIRGNKFLRRLGK